MNKNTDIERFANSPTLLVDLCRAVVVHLSAQKPCANPESDTGAMEAQLREIAKTIDRLEKLGVPIPDVLRAEKTRLAAALGLRDDAIQALAQLADSLIELSREIRAGLNPRKVSSNATDLRVNRETLERLPRAALRESMIKCLRKLGGSDSPKRILESMDIDLRERFLPGDLFWLEWIKAPSWHRSAMKERKKMIQEDVLKGDSPVGTWELSEKYK
jgi:hypothetical protein